MCEDCLFYVSPEDALVELGIELPSKCLCYCCLQEKAVFRSDPICNNFLYYEVFC